MPKGLVCHDRAEIRPANPDVDDVADALAGCPFQAPLRTRLQNGHLVEHRMNLRHDILAIHHNRRALGVGSATCSTARFSVSKLSVSLENGWILTSVNQDLDSKTSSNIDAMAGLIKVATPGGLFALSARPQDPKAFDNREAGPTPLPDESSMDEVRIGYDEAVLGRDPFDGSRRLLGSRYVGFLPVVPGTRRPLDGRSRRTVRGRRRLAVRTRLRACVVRLRAAHSRVVSPDRALIRECAFGLGAIGIHLGSPGRDDEPAVAPGDDRAVTPIDRHRIELGARQPPARRAWPS